MTFVKTLRVLAIVLACLVCAAAIAFAAAALYLAHCVGHGVIC